MAINGRTESGTVSTFSRMAPNKPGQYGKRIIRTFTGVRKGFEHLGRREWQFHATKGWRNYRDVKGVS